VEFKEISDLLSDINNGATYINVPMQANPDRVSHAEKESVTPQNEFELK
jgi:hypothetical protein